jgi:BlaI family transcriptional regulator, penicillinase repressor
MGSPEGSLTPAQFEIMALLWDAPEGLSVAAIWDGVKADREVSRNTVLNLVDRLEKRNWLVREKVGGIFRYQAAVDRESTQGQLAEEFVGEFFDGSALSLMLSLLGSKRISRAELKRLKTMFEESNTKKS